MMRSAKKKVFWGFVYLLCLLFIAFALLPYFWILSTSLKTESATYAKIPSFIPNPVTFANYDQIFHDRNILSYFKNTIVIALLSTGISVVVAVFGAYGFSRFRFPGRTPLLFSILFTRVLPRVSLLVPFYVILSKLSLINTYQGIILVYLIIGMPVTIWLLKGYIDALPYEVEEAAVVDGCNPMQVLFRIVIPMVAPAIASIAMFAFILAWNEFLFPLLIAKDSSTRPISVGLAFFIDDVNVQWGALMAASILMSIPAIVAFSFAQRYIIKGLSEGAVKG